MPKEYPLFIIDRNRRSRDENHNFDYIVCLDRQYGFVAKIILFHKEAFDVYLEAMEKVDNNKITTVSMPFKNGKLGIVLQVVDFLYNYELNNLAITKIKSLLKKAIKKYVHAELSTVPKDENFSINNQILAIENLLKELKMENNFKKMISHMGEKNTLFYIECVARAIESLKELHKLSN